MNEHEASFSRWAIIENIVTILASAWLVYLVSPWFILLMLNMNFLKFKNR